MSERNLDDQIRRLAEDLGLLRYHTWNSQRSPSGFPDLVLIGGSGILFRELKRERYDPTPMQQAWLSALENAGGDSGVWRPSDLLSGRIARELTAIAAVSSAPGSG